MAVAKIDNVVGFKDGTGNLDQVARIVSAITSEVDPDFLFFNGLPTAETFALPLLQLGMSTYSSAMYNFVPEFALAFYADVRAQDRAAVTEKLNRFVLPYLPEASLHLFDDAQRSPRALSLLQLAYQRFEGIDRAAVGAAIQKNAAFCVNAATRAPQTRQDSGPKVAGWSRHRSRHSPVHDRREATACPDRLLLFLQTPLARHRVEHGFPKLHHPLHPADDWQEA